MKPSVDVRGNAILRRLRSNPIVVEVGVFVGTLSRYLLSVRYDLMLIAIDNWAPSHLQPDCYRATNDRHSRSSGEEVTQYRLAAKRRVHKYRDRVAIKMMTSIEAAKQIEPDSVDLVFLDADHSESGVKADLTAWESKIKSGGFIGGHDYGNDSVPGSDYSGVKRAVDTWANGRVIEMDADFTWFCRI